MSVNAIVRDAPFSGEGITTVTQTLADGTRIEVNGCDLFTFRSGKIVHKDSYFKNRPT